jgi:predicted P-loop ATPase
VRDYLAGLVWDGIPRLDTWLAIYAGAENTEINRQFGRLTLIAAVRRVRHPGTKFDAMVVLEGPEGRNKSTLFEVLANNPEWFSDDAPLNAEARETIERLRGKWIIEAADLSAVKRTDVERLKAFLARKKDTATLKFERETTTALRECIFVGTTNSSEYLQSKTGNRRFWPVRTGIIDIDALRRDRDQLWAEAAHLESTGASIVLPEKLWAAAAEEQEMRRKADLWEDEIKKWLDERRGTERPWVSPAEVAQAVLNLMLKDLDGTAQSRVFEAMRLAGWSKDAGKKVRGVRLWGPDDRVV